MVRRLGRSHSQNLARLLRKRPRLDLLEDRLAPGSMFDFFGLAAVGLSGQFETTPNSPMTKSPHRRQSYARHRPSIRLQLRRG